MAHYIHKSENLTRFIESLSRRGPVYFAASIDGKNHMVNYADAAGSGIVPDFTKIRTAQNIKHFFLPSRGIVARFPEDVDRRAPAQAFLIGVKGCDLHGLDVYDRVFGKWEPADPVYLERRSRTVIISSDCPEPGSGCFCNLTGGKPYADSLSDINITRLQNGLFFDALSDRGESLIADHGELFESALPEHDQERDTVRRRAEKRLEEVNPKAWRKNLSALVEQAPEENVRKALDGCVECFACLHACPTCYCFLLSDHKRGPDMERVRTWDACYYAAYARVGGGANPRPTIDERFWNRFQCKFNYFPQYESIAACSGCGRCFNGCSAKIDIREILQGL